MDFVKKAYNNFFSNVKKINFYDSLQDLIVSKKDYCNQILSNITNLSNCLNDFHIRVSNLSSNLDLIEVSQEEKNIHILIESIYKGILDKFTNNIKALDDINIHFKKYIEILNTEIKIYKEFKEVYLELYKEKEKLKKNEDNFHKTGVEKEQRIIQFVDRNIQCMNQIEQNEFLMDELEQMIYPTKLAYQIYIKNMDNVNYLIGIYNQKHCKYFNYLPEVVAKDDVFYYNLINTYVILLNGEHKKITEEISKYQDAQNIEKKENNTELKKLVEIYEKNKKEEEKKKFEQYPTKIIFTNCKTKKQFEVYFKSMSMIKKYIDEKNKFPNYEYDKELKNFKMNELIQKLFSNKTEEINQNLKDSFNDLIENPDLYHTFFVILSRIRSNGTFCQSKALITLLGDGFEIILTNSKKNKLYENVKNAIILSQTYYYEDEKKEKIYIFEFIKNNKWLKTAKFWRNFIEYNTENELKRFDKNKDKDNYKLGEAVFSQLLTFASNMKSFELDKRVIIKIIDEFLDKYNYVSETNKKVIYQLIIQGNGGNVNIDEELIKLRKEYNESLEHKNDEDKHKKEKIQNNENKEEIKNENKEENKEEIKNENKEIESKNEEKKEDEKEENINEENN